MKEVKELSDGEAFGELALLNKKPRAATILCKEDCHFAVLDKKHFKMILSE
jgi:CRP-like cAMP-binding protein